MTTKEFLHASLTSLEIKHEINDDELTIKVSPCSSLGERRIKLHIERGGVCYQSQEFIQKLKSLNLSDVVGENYKLNFDDRAKLQDWYDSIPKQHVPVPALNTGRKFDFS